jgi:voltage-gated potassium channel
MMTLKPLIFDFIDTIIDRQGHELTLEDVKIEKGSPMDGIILKESLRRIRGAHILAIKKKSGQLLTNPSPETVLESGDELVLMGTRDQLKGLENST